MKSKKIMVFQQSTKAVKANAESGQVSLVIEDAIGFLLAVTSRLMDRTLNGRLQKYGVSFGQWPILMSLWAEEGLSQRELSRRVSNEEATTTRTLDRMEADELIRREPVPGDRRQRKIYLTTKGRALRDKLVPEAMENTAIATKGLSKKEVDALRLALKAIILSLQGELTGPAKNA